MENRNMYIVLILWYLLLYGDSHDMTRGLCFIIHLILFAGSFIFLIANNKVKEVGLGWILIWSVYPTLLEYIIAGCPRYDLSQEQNTP